MNNNSLRFAAPLAAGMTLNRCAAAVSKEEGFLLRKTDIAG
jgi:hypothetical protein